MCTTVEPELEFNFTRKQRRLIALLVKHVDDVKLAGEKDIGGANPSIVMNDNENQIGGRDHNASWFVGVMDEFAMFNRALDEQEIQRWMDLAFAVDPRGRLATMWGRVKAE